MPTSSVTTQRMKRALANALLDLMAKKPLESITVQEVTQVCEIRRQSFYYHFSDLYALLDWILAEKRQAFRHSWEDYLNWQSYFLAVLQNIEDNRAHYQCITNALGTPYLLRLFQEDLTQLLEKTLDFYFPEHLVLSKKDKEFLVFYYEKQSLSMLECWLRQDIPYCAQDLVEQIDTALQDHVRGLTQRCARQSLDGVEDSLVFALPLC